MKFNLLKRKKNNVISNSNDNEKTREKFILKGWIESSRKATCTKNGTRGFLCRLHKLVLDGKMTFSCPTTCTDSYTRRENRCQIPFKTSLTPSKMDFSAGRSMVEMLGVLAIIGVLSIGGISGYTIAMRKHQANEILQVANKYATILYTNCLSAQLDGIDYPDWYQWYTENYNQENSEKHSDSSDNSFEPKVLFCPDPIDFQSTGLGALPQGIEGFDLTADFQNTYLIKSNSGDIIRMYIRLKSKEVCQSIINTIGTKAKASIPYPTGLCEYDYNGYLALVYFIMN